MSLLCDLNNILNDQIYSIYSQSGYRILTNEEYNKEIKSRVKEVSKLYKDNIIDTAVFAACVVAITEKFIENQVELIFSTGSDEYWAMPVTRWGNEKRVRK